MFALIRSLFRLWAFMTMPILTILYISDQSPQEFIGNVQTIVEKARIAKQIENFSDGVLHIIQDFISDLKPNNKAQPKKKIYRASVYGAEHVLNTAIYRAVKPYIGRVSYRWGGESVITGMDCSAFTQHVLAKFGVCIPRTSRNQSMTGKRVRQSELKAGDLIFFDTIGYRPGIDHVGIYLGNGHFVHSASGRGVEIRRLSAYRYRVSLARRVLS